MKDKQIMKIRKQIIKELKKEYNITSDEAQSIINSNSIFTEFIIKQIIGNALIELVTPILKDAIVSTLYTKEWKKN